MRVLIITLAILVPLPAQAEMLLVTIDYDQATQTGKAGLAFGPPGTYWYGQYTAADIGTTIEFPSEIVSSWSTILQGDDTWFSLGDGGLIENGGTVDWFWHPLHGPSFGASPAVPQLGHGLNGYELTRVTQTLNEIRQVGGPITFTTIFDETLRLYGNALPVPEPPSFALLLIAHFSIQFVRRAPKFRRCRT